MKQTLFFLFCMILAAAKAQTPGTLDSSFNGNGIVLLQPGTLQDVVYDMATAEGQKILIAGVARMVTVGWNSDIAVGQLNPDGLLDVTFGNNGWYTKDFNNASDFGWILE
ncbi:MAG: hypothetical protein WCO63_12650 [Bacteroidota bacterium]